MTMYRFIYRRRRLLLYFFACLMLYSLMRMVADDSFERQKSLFHPRMHKKVSLRRHGSHHRHAAAKPHVRSGHEQRKHSLKHVRQNKSDTKELQLVTKQNSPGQHGMENKSGQHRRVPRRYRFVWLRKRRHKRRRKRIKFSRGLHKTAAPIEEPKSDWVPPPNPGEHGGPVKVGLSQLSAAQRHKYYEGKKLHHFNLFVSDLISLHRALPKPLEPECHRQQYLKELPTTSVVIIYHNEAWSTLLRTVHSVLDRSPPHLLDHIILVDDFSDMAHLKKPLDDYLSKPEMHKVKVVRSRSREGLIKARLLGLSHVTSPTVVFLDSHCECAEGWLEPLLDRIARNQTTVVLPVIDTIDMETFQLHMMPAKSINVGTFSWNLLFNWMPIQPSEKLRRKSDVDPVRTPTMPGGLFAIDRAFFNKLGTYDPEMKIWGAENLELSFKIWMCGGTLEIIPCSHVGHVFRRTSPHSSGGFRNYLSVNLARLTAVWLDEYSYYVNRARRVRQKDVAKVIGNISERLELRRRLKCHSFGWYMKNVMPEKYLPADQIAHGPIENKFTGLCIIHDGEHVGVEECRKGRGFVRRSLWWHMNPGESTVFQESFNLQRKCMDYSGNNTVRYLPCHNLGGNQLWKYHEHLKQLFHVVTMRCATVAAEAEYVGLVMTPCNPDDPRQQWLWNTSPPPGPSWRRDLAAGKAVL